MSRIIEISDKRFTKNRWLDVIFIHGLNGNHLETWKSEPNSDPWPKWISNLQPGIRVLCYDYDIGFSRFSTPNTLSIIDRTQNTLDLFSIEGVGDVPIGLICHSYGGLLAKSVIRASNTSHRTDYKKISDNARFVVFLGTPHSGSSIANWCDKMGFLLPSEAINDLKRNSPYLRELNQWYISFYQRNHIETVSYHETKKTHGVLVVDVDSADLGIPDYPSIPLDEDHISISKPKDQFSHVFKRTMNIIDDFKKKVN